MAASTGGERLSTDDKDPGVSYHETGETPDMVNHPPHYADHPSGVECIDVIEWFNSPNLANVVKYVWRVDSGGKWDDIEDLRKAEFYLKREIERRKHDN